MQLSVVEISTLGSIVCFKYIIDYLKNPAAYSSLYSYSLFGVFVILRITMILARSYYDLHVYNYYRFVQTKLQCWLFELACDLRQY